MLNINRGNARKHVRYDIGQSPQNPQLLRGRINENRPFHQAASGIEYGLANNENKVKIASNAHQDQVY